MKIALRGLGTALPAGSVEQSNAADAADRLRRLDDSPAADKKSQMLSILYRRSGVKKRHCILLSPGTGDPLERQTFYQATKDLEHRGPSTLDRMSKFESLAPDLAVRASSLALADAQCEAQGITHLVTVCCSGFAAPGFDLELIPRLGLSPCTPRTHVGFMGCHGFLNGLRVARAYASTEPTARVLVCAVELCTLHHQYTDDPQQIVANSLFADGAAAAVVEQASALTLSSDTNCFGDFRASGSYRIPNTEELMSWRIGDHGFQMTLSVKVPETIKRELRPWMVEWLASHGLGIDDIRHWAIHPGGPRILTAAAEALELPSEATEVSTSVLAECGNMSSPTVLFIMERMRRLGYQPPIVALAFGPGLVVEATLFA